jgi:molecular chaperone HtpG
MTKDEMESNLGTIARSGSLKFKSEMEHKEDIDIIGQFGVGFYSAFMVASNVTVISRAYGSDEAFCWQSSGSDGYTITPCERDTWGTTVVMRIKDDTDEEQYSQYLTEDELTMLVRKYSDYIRYPIKLEITQTDYEKDEKGEEKEVSKRENTILNSMIPVWQKAKKDVSKEEYDNFYTEKFSAYDNRR